ncbi:MAG TPA: hypothetical protein VGR95_18360 [Thermoanaerobaculia bacterium]|jgi:hypothetical protein|nr:hypothetical protein [Thermoanaerobaculia bacterium]
MKLHRLAVLLLTIASTPAAHAGCEAMTTYLKELSAGRKPAIQLAATGCDKPDTEAVAAALAAFAAKTTSAADADAVIEQVRTAFEERGWTKPYAKLSSVLLHSLVLQLVERHPQPVPPPPAAKPVPPVRQIQIRVHQDPFPWLPWSILGVAIFCSPIPVLFTLRQVRGALTGARADQAGLARNLQTTAGKLDTALQQIDAQLQTTSNALTGKVEAVSLLKQEHLASITAAIAELRKDLGARTSDPVALEHQVLCESWKQFSANPALRAAYDEAVGDAPWKPLLDQLPKTIPADLQSSFDAVYAPCKEYREFVRKLSLIPRIVDREIQRRPNDVEELRRTRELAAILAAAQGGADGANPLNFRFKRWVTDTFLPFADLYLQRVQQAGLEERGADFQHGAALIRQLMQVASVEAIEVQLGKTPFDSTRHIGRATSNDPRFADGVITGVVRNGFIEGGQQVIRQPEVIVNRMR